MRQCAGRRGCAEVHVRIDSNGLPVRVGVVVAKSSQVDHASVRVSSHMPCHHRLSAKGAPLYPGRGVACRPPPRTATAAAPGRCPRASCPGALQPHPHCHACRRPHHLHYWLAHSSPSTVPAVPPIPPLALLFSPCGASHSALLTPRRTAVTTVHSCASGMMSNGLPVLPMILTVM